MLLEELKIIEPKKMKLLIDDKSAIDMRNHLMCHALLRKTSIITVGKGIQPRHTNHYEVRCNCRYDAFYHGSRTVGIN